MKTNTALKKKIIQGRTVYYVAGVSIRKEGDKVQIGWLDQNGLWMSFTLEETWELLEALVLTLREVEADQNGSMR